LVASPAYTQVLRQMTGKGAAALARDHRIAVDVYRKDLAGAFPLNPWSGAAIPDGGAD
jgi:hypothetical protein